MSSAAAPADREPPPPTSPRERRKVVVGSLVGTSLEWYDFFLYGSAAALVFGPLFFPGENEAVQSLLALSTYAVAFIARPFGGVVFGALGDRVGRRRVLVITLMTMGVATMLIGVLPSYDSIGILAPILLVLLRIVQGLGLGGEWGGAVLMTMEHGDPKRRGLWASFPQIGVPAGNLLAAGVLGFLALVLSESAFESWGWRIPFLLSAVLVFVGLWIRRSMEESPSFVQAVEAGEGERTPLRTIFREHPRELVQAIAGRAGSDAVFYLFVVFSIDYLQDELALSRSTALTVVISGSIAGLFMMPVAGALSDRFGRRLVSIVGLAGCTAWIFAFFPLLDTRSTLAFVVAGVVGLIFHALVYGPQASFIAELFPARVRSTGTSLGYQLAGIFGGAFAPVIATALLAGFGGTILISVYAAILLVIGIVAILLTPEGTARTID